MSTVHRPTTDVLSPTFPDENNASKFSEFLRKPEPIDFENYEHHYHRKGSHLRNFTGMWAGHVETLIFRVPRAVMENIESYYKNDYVYLRKVIKTGIFHQKMVIFTKKWLISPKNRYFYRKKVT